MVSLMSFQSFKGLRRVARHCTAMEEGAQTHCMSAWHAPIPGGNRLFPDKGWAGETTPCP